MRYAITGATSYTGRYLSNLLLSSAPPGVPPATGAASTTILNLSSRPRPIATHNLPPEMMQSIHSQPLCFDDPASLTASLSGCDALFATYWIRFEAAGDTHAEAAERARTLFSCAAAAGVKKIVFSSHTRASEGSPFSYIKGKATAERYLREIAAERNINYAIVRPCGIFGDTPAESILMNNASYVLRRAPLFLCAGDGSTRFQPVHVRDMAELMAELGTSTGSSGEELDATGPDAPTSLELFRALAKASGAFHGGAFHLITKPAPRQPQVLTRSFTRFARPILCARFARTQVSASSPRTSPTPW